jgi:hypothetical protein
MKPVKPLILALFLVPIHVNSAEAYLDPGTGSLMLQSMLALFAGAAVTLKLYWAKLKSFFAHDKGDPANHEYELN